MKIDLNGKRALVTGASSGMGAAIAESFAAAGARVAVHARTVEKAAPTVERIEADGGNAFAVAAELDDSDAILEMCDKATTDLGGIDIVMSNAGMFGSASVVHTSEAAWEDTMTINLKAPFIIAKHTLETMIEQGTGGRQLFTSSVSAKMAELDASAYCASKAGLHGLMRSMAIENGSHGITVNAICPGWVDTPMARAGWKRNLPEGEPFEEFYRQGMNQNMLGGVIEPVDIANMAVFLASDAGRFVTAQAINVCAGICPTL